jgi:formate dehydrogenase subunit gamma
MASDMMTSETQKPAAQPGSLKTARRSKQAQAAHLRKTIALAGRVQVQADGSRRFVRFNQIEILEHWVLLINFFVLAITGMIQFFAGLDLVAWAINSLMGGISNLNAIHRAAGAMFVALSLFHAVRILSIWIVKGERGAMMPSLQDARDFGAKIRYNLGKGKERPLFGRFTIEEKLSYWALLIFAVLMILTGLALWYPTVATWLLPGIVIPVARTLHSTTAILAILVVLTWHLYYTVVRERNKSIFTGKMSEREMQENHALELRRILDAYEEVQKLSKEK